MWAGARFYLMCILQPPSEVRARAAHLSLVCALAAGRHAATKCLGSPKTIIAVSRTRCRVRPISISMVWSSGGMFEPATCSSGFMLTQIRSAQAS